MTMINYILVHILLISGICATDCQKVEFLVTEFLIKFWYFGKYLNTRDLITYFENFLLHSEKQILSSIRYFKVRAVAVYESRGAMRVKK